MRKDAHTWNGPRCSVCARTTADARVDETIDQLSEIDTQLGGVLMIMDLARYGEGEALRGTAKSLLLQYTAFRALLSAAGTPEATAALAVHNLALKYLESSQIQL
jgi:hypothetical protein